MVVYNNLIARLRRTPGSLAEASMDLGARGWQTLRYITLPLAATALVSGALLAFALSFDEVIVTVFTAGAQNTLPLWIFGAIRLGQQLPEVNAVVSVVILLTLIPVVLAARLAGRRRDQPVSPQRRGRRGHRGHCVLGPAPAAMRVSLCVDCSRWPQRSPPVTTCFAMATYHATGTMWHCPGVITGTLSHRPGCRAIRIRGGCWLKRLVR